MVLPSSAEEWLGLEGHEHCVLLLALETQPVVVVVARSLSNYMSAFDLMPSNSQARRGAYH